MPQNQTSNIIKTDKRRILLFVHYNPQALLSDYVLHTLREVRPFFQRIVFVSNSPLTAAHRSSLEAVVDKITERENDGYDFAAWKDALLDENWERIEKFDVLTLMNDSCFGPFFELEKMFDEMENREFDFWGITGHSEYRYGNIFTGIKVSAHLQSYFMSFKRSTFMSDAFKRFWQKVKSQKTRQKVVDKYEIGLSKALTKAEFRYGVYIEPELEAEDFKNAAAFIRPDHMLKKEAPFIKIKSFFLFTHTKFLKQIIRKDTDYNFKLIEDHIYKTFNPTNSIRVLDKNILFSSNNHEEKKSSDNLKTAIHLHAYYPEVSKFLTAFQNIRSTFDLFITTDSETKAGLLEEQVSKYDLQLGKLQTEIVENRGRDVLAWLKLSERFSEYEIAGHFHSKKSASAPDWVGETWVQEIVDSLLVEAENIFRLFKNNDDLGIVIPDIPFFFKTNLRSLLQDEEQDFILDLWTELDTKKSIEKDDMYAPIMSYGNMFWYRPSALKPLYKYDKFKDKFPEEPIQPKHTLAHQFERLPVYVAWSENYDFRVILNPKTLFSGYDVENKSEISNMYKQLQNTPAWRIGRTITWFPGKIKRLFR